MGTGQMLLTIGAIVLLGSIIVTTNRGINNSSQVVMTTAMGIDAVSLATSTIEKAQESAFDRATMDSTWTVSTSKLASPSILGKRSATDTIGDYYDQFNGWGPNGPGPTSCLLDSDSLATGWYMVKTQVHYVTRNYLTGKVDTTTASATWSKQLDVWVWNKADTVDKVHMIDVFSYWY